MASITKNQRRSALLLAIAAWTTLTLQVYLTTGSIFNFISYFTILSNILVALTLSFSALAPSSTIGKYFGLVKTQSAIALYIFIVGLVYNLILRGIWQPTGLQLMVDNLLHVVVPLFYMVYWFAFTPKGILNWRDILSWTYFPFAYLIYSLIRGHFTTWYPYPFLNVNKIGYTNVILNSGLMVIAFVVIGLLLISINRFMGRKI